MQENKMGNQGEKANDGGRSYGLTDKLKEKQSDEVRERARKAIVGGAMLVASWLLGGAEMFFGTFPLGIALLCASSRHLIFVTAGLVLSFVTEGLPVAYIFSYIAVLTLRFIISYVPESISERHDGEKEQSEGAEYSSDGYVSGRIEGGKKKNAEAYRFLFAFERLLGIKREEKQNRRARASGAFGENVIFRMLCAGVGGFIAGLFGLIENDFAYYDLYGAFFMIVASPIAVLLLSGLSERDAPRGGWNHTLSYGALMSFCVFASKDLYIFNMPMQPMLAMLFVLCVSSRRTLPLGICAGLLLGAVFDLVYIPLLCVAAVLFCLISPLKKTAGLAAVCAAIVIWCYYFGNVSGLVGVLPPMLLSVPVFLVAEKYFTFFSSDKKGNIGEGSDGFYFAAAVTEKNKGEAVKDRLTSLSDAFSSLSETFYKLSDRFRRPDMLGLKKLTDSSFERVCEGCRNRDVCWGAEYADTLDAVRCITASLHTKGKVDREDLPEKFLSSCMRTDKLISDVNIECARATEGIIRSEKIGVFASNYDDMTSILRDALESDRDEYVCDTQIGGRVYEYLCSVGLNVSGVVVCGKRCRHVVVKGIGLGGDQGSISSGELCRRISDLVGVRMSGPVLEVGKDGTIMLFSSRPGYRAICSHGRVAAADTSIGRDTDKIYLDPFSEDMGADKLCCGDTTDAFLTDNSYFYSLISDGMGSGAEAAFVSGVSAMFIEKMLSAGNRADITLRMLNNFLRSENSGCGGECSVTVDLMELDLMNGTASFIKSGAAPTYILRTGTVYKVSSRTMPIGIIKDPDARITKFDMKVGDIVVMVSDGCCPDSDDCPWLVELLCDVTPPDKIDMIERGSEFTDKLKDDILRVAREKYPSDRSADDVSVSVVLVA